MAKGKPIDSLPPVSKGVRDTMPPRTFAKRRAGSYVLASFIVMTLAVVAYIALINPLMGEFRLQAGVVAALVFASFYLLIWAIYVLVESHR